MAAFARFGLKRGGHACARAYSVSAAVCTKIGAPLEHQSAWVLPTLGRDQVVQSSAHALSG